MNTILTFYFISVAILMSPRGRIHYYTNFSGFQQKEGIELIISNIRNKQGIIRIGLFRTEKGYPDKPAESYSLAKDTISGGILRLFIPCDKPGRFGFSILDDENMDGKMNYILKIIPKEGFGFSNNPAVSGKAPPFNETSISYSGGIKKVTVKMVYI